MPDFIFNDTFVEYSAGPLIPNSFQAGPGNIGLLFNSLIIDTGTQPSPSPAPGFYEKTGNVYFLFGPISFPINNNLADNVTPTTSVFWSTLALAGNTSSPGVLILCTTNPETPDNPIVILTTAFEADNSLSILVPGAQPLNTLFQSYSYDTWHDFMIIVQLRSLVIDGVSYIVVSLSLMINGLLYFDGVQLVSNIALSSTWNGQATLNQWIFNGIANGDYFSEIAATTDIQTLPFYPNPVDTVNALMSTATVETIQKSFSPSGRTSQLVVETVEQPIRKARMSQAVVELILKGTFSGQQGFYVRES